MITSQTVLPLRTPQAAGEWRYSLCQSKATSWWCNFSASENIETTVGIEVSVENGGVFVEIDSDHAKGIGTGDYETKDHRATLNFPSALELDLFISALTAARKAADRARTVNAYAAGQ